MHDHSCHFHHNIVKTGEKVEDNFRLFPEFCQNDSHDHGKQNNLKHLSVGQRLYGISGNNIQKRIRHAG